MQWNQRRTQLQRLADAQTYQQLQPRIMLFLVLGIVSGVVSLIPPLCFGGAGLVYGGLVLTPWALLQGHSSRVIAATLITSGVGYLVAVLLVPIVMATMQIIIFHWTGSPNEQASLPEYALAVGAAGVPGLGLAMIPLLVKGQRAVLGPVVAALGVAAFVLPLILLLLAPILLGLSGGSPVHDMDYFTLLLLLPLAWQPLTAVALSLAQPAVTGNSNSVPVSTA